MANYSDLNTLFQNGMGSWAAAQAGQQTGMEQQLQALKMQQLQEEMAQQKQLNPLAVMYEQEKLKQAQAMTPGLQADSSLKQVNADTAQQTQASNIATMLSKNSAQIGEDGMKQMGQEAQKFISAAAILEQVPSIQRPAALTQIAAKYGVSEDSPFLKQFQQTDPAKLPDALRNMGQGMALASEDYIKNSALQKSKQTFEAGQNDLDRRNRLATAGVGANATIEAAKIGAASRENIAAKNAQARSLAANNKLTIDQRISALEVIPDSEKTDDDRRALAELKTQQLKAHAAGANAVPAQVLGMQSPQDIAAGISGQAPAKAPSVPADWTQIGTSGGKPVYQDSKGNKFIGK